MERYTVKARIKKRLFRNPVMVFDVIRHYQYWHDRSCGNGGGDMRDACETVITYDIVEAAENAAHKLNTYKG